LNIETGSGQKDTSTQKFKTRKGKEVAIASRDDIGQLKLLFGCFQTFQKGRPSPKLNGIMCMGVKGIRCNVRQSSFEVDRVKFNGSSKENMISWWTRHRDQLTETTQKSVERYLEEDDYNFMQAVEEFGEQYEQAPTVRRSTAKKSGKRRRGAERSAKPVDDASDRVRVLISPLRAT
jgi:hypothetical protein